MMATRSIRHLGNPAVGSSDAQATGERVDLNGTQITETIKASGHKVPRKQARHMTAIDQAANTEIFLANQGPSTHDPSALRSKF